MAKLPEIWKNNLPPDSGSWSDLWRSTVVCVLIGAGVASLALTCGDTMADKISTSIGGQLGIVWSTFAFCAAIALVALPSLVATLGTPLWTQFSRLVGDPNKVAMTNEAIVPAEDTILKLLAVDIENLRCIFVALVIATLLTGVEAVLLGAQEVLSYDLASRSVILAMTSTYSASAAYRSWILMGNAFRIMFLIASATAKVAAAEGGAADGGGSRKLTTGAPEEAPPSVGSGVSA